ncbi:competence protein ComK [Staphylococcus sp. SQ8-PEA]|uniref:Competence protein ComK n=1 Tax=Staphylococcus marylandisciuri TaxID=2981529 RepID=A0ABT2QPX2_9STAP|nr:competence protein ComK [Staphylococcus marylandisciuri]MCU5746018.1 competence protein ComK [Staphylococcus marylandisciuri]
MNESYVIRKDDMAIQPYPTKRGLLDYTKILKFKSPELIAQERTQKIIERSCKFYGSTYAYKKNDATRMTEIVSKPPILLTPLFPTYFFPTHSDRKLENAWVNIHFIQSIKALRDKRCKIIFVDNQSITVNISEHSLRHQYHNAVFYYYKMDRAARVTTYDPEAPIDYSKEQMNIFEALVKYAQFQQKP